MIWPLLPRFQAFPQAFLGMLQACLRMATTNDVAADALSVCLGNICREAMEALSDHKYLRFARTAAVLATSRTELERVYKARDQWDALEKTLQDVSFEADELGKNLNKEREAFRETRYAPQGRGEKRVCGDGVFKIAAHGLAGPVEVGPVIDFSKDHFYCAIPRALAPDGEYVGLLLPCQRELPFQVKVRGERTAPMNHGALHSCWPWYQVFHLVSVRPLYYYLALCLALRSNSSLDDAWGRAFMDRHELSYVVQNDSDSWDSPLRFFNGMPMPSVTEASP
jgi:hypothetical protein